ncbi:MAG: hypothetical protein ACOCVU_00940 [Desulfohalobiaceae bacterium]
MKTSFVLTAMVLVLCACQSMRPQEVVPVIEQVSAPPVVIEKSATVSVVVSPDRVEQSQTPQKALLDKGLNQGMTRIINDILNDKPLVHVSDHQLQAKPHSLLDTGQPFAAREDPVTSDFGASFELTATLTPVIGLTGMVVDLDDTRAIAAQNEYVTIRVAEPSFAAQDVFFMVGKAKMLNSGSYYEIIGSGKIISTSGDLAQSILMETVREIEIGDPVFLLDVEMGPVMVEEEVVPLQIEEAEEEEFVVQPMTEPGAPEEPAETK